MRTSSAYAKLRQLRLHCEPPRGLNSPPHALVNFRRAGVVSFGRASTDRIQLGDPEDARQFHITYLTAEDQITKASVGPGSIRGEPLAS